MQMGKVYIITECSKQVGMGHLYRCLSFYDQFISYGYEPCFIIDTDEECSQILVGRTYQFLHWKENIKLLSFINFNEIVFMDSISATQEVVDYCQQLTNFFIIIDDYKRHSYNHALIIDWTPNVEATGKHKHNIGLKNILLLGLDYSILRREFTNNDTYFFRVLKNITIIMGGTDIRELSRDIAESIASVYHAQNINVILGPGTKTFTSQFDNIHIYKSLNASEIKCLFMLSDVVVSAGGQTIFELAAIGVPTIPIQVVDNQKEDLRGLKDLFFFDTIYYWDSSNLCTEINQKISSLIDINKRKKYLSSFNVSGIGRGFDKIMTAINRFTHEGF